MNIFGDLSGYYKSFLKLLAKMPDEEPISLGDLNDRGPRTKELFDFFRNQGKVILGNHEHMMLDFLHGEKYYEEGFWYDTWGKETLRSFQVNDDVRDLHAMEEYRIWLESLPFFLEYEDILLTHAPLHPSVKLQDALNMGEDYLSHECDLSIVWNRTYPNKRREKFMVFGHNTDTEVRWFKDDQGPYGVCLDTSGYGVLTAMHWPSMKLYQQEIID
ncbi:MAG: metallophosphoesterase [Bacteriovoracaceae bacterium]